MAYQWVAQLGFAHDSWTAPVDDRRLHPSENTNHFTVEQMRVLLGRPGTDKPPIFVFDAGYDSVQLQQGVEETCAAVLVRLRSGRCFYANATPTPGASGRPRRHRQKFDCSNEATWLPPAATVRVSDDQYGAVRVRAWSGLHPNPRHHPGRARGPRATVRGTLVLVEVLRLPARVQQSQRLWL